MGKAWDVLKPRNLELGPLPGGATGSWRHWRLARDENGIAWLVLDKAGARVNTLGTGPGSPGHENGDGDDAILGKPARDFGTLQHGVELGIHAHHDLAGNALGSDHAVPQVEVERRVALLAVGRDVRRCREPGCLG